MLTFVDYIRASNYLLAAQVDSAVLARAARTFSNFIPVLPRLVVLSGLIFTNISISGLLPDANRSLHWYASNRTHASLMANIYLRNVRKIAIFFDSVKSTL